MNARDPRLTAELLIKQHGPEAVGMAAQRALDSRARSDRAGEAAWLAVVDAVLELQGAFCGPSKAQH